MTRWYLWIGAALGCLGDAVTTWYGLQVLGLAEQNPFMALLVSGIGLIPALVVAKVAVLGFAAVLSQEVDEFPWLPPAILIVVYGFVTMLNAIQIAVVV